IIHPTDEIEEAKVSLREKALTFSFFLPFIFPSDVATISATMAYVSCDDPYLNRVGDIRHVHSRVLHGMSQRDRWPQLPQQRLRQWVRTGGDSQCRRAAAECGRRG